MSQTVHEDLEKANNADSDQIWSTQNKPSQPSGGASSFGDSSGSLFSIYSKAAEEEDTKMVERWQKDADGILIFTGLFSAAVAALLAVTVQDLRPNSQDTSSFYLGNIYQILADPNATPASLPPPILKPPPFSPPRYTIWVNSLWFLSLVISLSCALLATSLHQWARRYLRLAQPVRCSPEKRARLRAIFADGLHNMHISWVVEGLPTLLHLSLFLFFGGLVIFLFHVDSEVFRAVVWWIGLFSMVYVSITLLPLIRHDSPYYAPLSTPAWSLYAGIQCVKFRILYIITSACNRCNVAPRLITRIQPRGGWVLWSTASYRYRYWMFRGVEMAAEAIVSDQYMELFDARIDARIFDWTIGALGDDSSLEKFFEAIPGFVNSKLVYNLRELLSDNVLDRLSEVAHGFMGRTWSSNSISDSEKLRRLDITTNAMALIRISDVSSIIRKILEEHWNEAPQSIELGHALARWCSSDDACTALYAQSIIGMILGSARERNDSWFALAARVSSVLAEHDLQADIADGGRPGDSVLLAILIRIARQCSRKTRVIDCVMGTLSKLDITKTLPRLQHDFCTLWNEIAQDLMLGIRPFSGFLACILNYLQPAYIALHQGTDGFPAAFFASTNYLDYFKFPITFGEQDPYPHCNVASHRSDPTTRFLPDYCAVSLTIQSGNSHNAWSPSRSGSMVSESQQVEQGDIMIAGPPFPSNSTTTSYIGEASQDLSSIPHTFPIDSGTPLTYAPPLAVDACVPCDDGLRDSHDHNQTIPMEVFHRPTQSLRPVPSPPDATSNSLELEGD